MLAHQGTVERSNADGYHCINSILVKGPDQGPGRSNTPNGGHETPGAEENTFAFAFAFMLLWSNKARGSITLELVGDKGPDTAIGGSSSQFTRAVHQKLVRLGSQFPNLQNNIKKVVEFIEDFHKAFEESQSKSQNAQQQASVPSMYWHMVPQVQPQ